MLKPTLAIPHKVGIFLEETRARLTQLGADEWCVELNELSDLSITYGLGLHELDPRAEIDATTIVHRSVPILEVVEAGEDGFRLGPDRRPAWIIDAHAPEVVILEEVKRALAERRKSNLPPVRKRGRHAPNNLIDDATFELWRTSKIVELGGLFAWRATLDPKEAKRYTNGVIGEWLGFWGSKSRE